MCSAPGGKALYAADKLHGTGQVLARDLTEYKEELLKENIERVGLKISVLRSGMPEFRMNAWQSLWMLYCAMFPVPDLELWEKSRTLSTIWKNPLWKTW